MAAPQAPMPLSNQLKVSTSVVITVVLRGLGPAPLFTDGGTTFNSGDPTATFTIAVPGAGPAASNKVNDLLDILDQLWRNGTATVA